MRAASKTGCIPQAEGDWERGLPAADGNQGVGAFKAQAWSPYLMDTRPFSPGASFISNPREGKGAGFLLTLPAGLVFSAEQLGQELLRGLKGKA